jgi:histidyl-tRNA synthetase
VMRAVGLEEPLVLLNSLGDATCRPVYREKLVEYFTSRADALCGDCRERLRTNPLRILDCKVPSCQPVLAGAPAMLEYLCDACREHFEGVQAALRALSIPFEVAPRLVRGLDYYTRTLFEIRGAADKLGAGSTLLGGGRYDYMVAGLGGPQVPALGFAAGLERLLIASEVTVPSSAVDALVAPLAAAAMGPALLLARGLRGRGVRCDVDTRGTSLKSQLRRANALGARVVLILGETELAEDVVQVKDLEAHTQERLAFTAAVPYVADRLRAAPSAAPQASTTPYKERA